MEKESINAPETPTSYRSCDICKRLKKKCDKKIPSCSRCIRVDAACDYGLGINSDSIGLKLDMILLHLRQIDERFLPSVLSKENFAHSSPYSAGQIKPHSRPKVPPKCHSHPDSTCPQDSQQSSTIDSHAWMTNPKLLTPSYLKTIYTANLSCLLLEFNVSLNQVLKYYIKSTHSWIPMLNVTWVSYQAQSFRDLEPIAASHALLLQTIHLIVSQNASHSNASETGLYLSCKQLLTILQAMDQEHMTLPLIQSGLLISVYEYGCGLLGKAHTTLGECLRMISVLGLHEKSSNIDIFENDEEIKEDTLRTWWAIVILDQHVTNELREFDLLFPIHVSYQMDTLRLPSTSATWDFPHKDFPHEDFFMDLTSHIMLDYTDFQRECRATQLLDRVLSITRGQSKDTALPGIDTLIAVDCHLQNLILELRTLDESNLNFCTGGLASCVTAVLALHSFNMKTMAKETNAMTDLIFSRSRVRDCVLFVFNLIQTLHGEHVQFLPPPAVNTIFQTILMVDYLIQQEDPHFSKTSATYVMKTELVNFLQKTSSQWGLAGKYLNTLT